MEKLLAYTGAAVDDEAGTVKITPLRSPAPKLLTNW